MKVKAIKLAMRIDNRNESPVRRNFLLLSILLTLGTVHGQVTIFKGVDFLAGESD
jgi:hypothetical protein